MRGDGWDNGDRPGEVKKGETEMEKGQGKEKDTLQTDKVFTRKAEVYIEPPKEET